MVGTEKNELKIAFKLLWIVIKITNIYMHCVLCTGKALAEIQNVCSPSVYRMRRFETGELHFGEILSLYLRFASSLCLNLCIFSLLCMDMIFIRFVNEHRTSITYALTLHCWRSKHSAEQHQIMRKSLRLRRKVKYEIQIDWNLCVRLRTMPCLSTAQRTWIINLLF